MGPITVSLLITTLIFMALYFFIRGLTRTEIKKQMPTQLQELRNKVKGDLKVMLEVKESGETKIVEVEKANE